MTDGSHEAQVRQSIQNSGYWFKGNVHTHSVSSDGSKTPARASLSIKLLLEAIKKGHFYSSTGPEIKDISIDDNGITSVGCSPVKYISFVSTPSLGMKFHAENEPLTKAVYPGRPGETYVRVEVTDYEGRTAWSNPIYNS